MVPRKDELLSARATTILGSLLVGLGGLAGTACSDTADGEPQPATEDDIIAHESNNYLDQGWSKAERDTFHFAKEAAQLIPYEWFLAVEREGSQKHFIGADNIRFLGYLPNSAGPDNPDGLPVGFTRHDDPESGAWVGVNCAACHTGAYSYKGRSFRVDGTQTRGDWGEFQRRLSRALTATSDDDHKFARFAKKVLGNNASDQARSDLRAELATFSAAFATIANQNFGDRRFGPGRVDSLNEVYNSIVCRGIGVPENCQNSNMATASPPLWLTTELDWDHTNGNQHIPVIRDLVQALGFTRFTVSETGAVDHPVDLESLKDIDDQVSTLQPPKWPEHVFGKINQARATAGKALYQANCESCHALPPYPLTEPNAYGRKLIQIKRIPLSQIGVDPSYTQNHLGRTALPGPLAPLFPSEFIGPDGKVPAVAIAKVVAEAALAKSFADLGADAAEQLRLLDNREPLPVTVEDLQSVIGRPLAGVALSGYFLHNGSVRTMYQLLLPPSAREKSFYVGTTEYDPKEMGFVSDPKAPNAYEFRTDLPGDSNAGHDYGTALSDQERYALIEFMKTL